MDLQLTGKHVLVTGSSRGLGKAIAARLVAEGAKVTICARGEDQLRQTADELGASTLGTVEAVPCDITNPTQAAELLKTARNRFGPIELLVNNAGGNRRKPFEDTSDDDWRELMEWNLFSGLRLARGVLPDMRKIGGGAIVFMASIFGKEAGGPGLSLYNASKSAVISAAKIMAVELAPLHIRVNSVAPGSVRYPGGSWDKRVQSDPEGMAKFVEENLPLGRFGSAEEIGDLVAFLLSPRASLVTGACVSADGAQGKSF